MAAPQTEYVNWEDRPGWEDVKPIPQADTQDVVAPINYSPQYANAADVFRYLLSVGEYSERSMAITEAMIRMNPAHYTAWNYRGDTILKTQSDINKELDLMDELVKMHLKNYQVWQHRRKMVLALGSATREIPFTTRALNIDGKNYHTWAYRQWALCHFYGPGSDAVHGTAEEKSKVWAGELDYVEELLTADIFNNSAWNHRFFTVFDSRAGHGDEAEAQQREIDYTKAKIDIAPSNASAWNYLRGILDRTKRSYKDFIPYASALLEQRGDKPASVPAAEFLADAHAEQALSHKAADSTEQAVKLFGTLAAEWDPIRKPYWDYRAKQVQTGIAA